MFVAQSEQGAAHAPAGDTPLLSAARSAAAPPPGSPAGVPTEAAGKLPAVGGVCAPAATPLPATHQSQRAQKHAGPCRLWLAICMAPRRLRVGVGVAGRTSEAGGGGGERLCVGVVLQAHHVPVRRLGQVSDACTYAGCVGRHLRNVSVCVVGPDRRSMTAP